MVSETRFRDAFLASLGELPQGSLRTVWDGRTEPFTELMKYRVLVWTARRLGLSSAHEYRRIDAVFYATEVAEVIVAIEIENNCRSVYKSELPKLGGIKEGLKVLIAPVSKKGEPDSISEKCAGVIRTAPPCDAAWLLILLDPRIPPKVTWHFYSYRKDGGLRKLPE
jgi:hypothetical protein